MSDENVTLYCSSTTISELRSTLQVELDMAVEWVKMNKLVPKLNALYSTMCIQPGTSALHLLLQATTVPLLILIILLI